MVSRFWPRISIAFACLAIAGCEQSPSAAGNPQGAARAEEPTWEDYFPGVNAELLKDIRDKENFTAAEAKPFYHLLKILQESPSEKLQAASRGRPQLGEFFARPQAYRGQLVTVSGSIKKAELIRPGENEAAIKSYWQFRLSPGDDTNAEIRVVSLEVPDGFQPEKAIGTKAEFIGFYFKPFVWRPTGNEGKPLVRVSPLILAKAPH